MPCGAGPVDHFEGWMILLGGVVAAIIALAGVGLAGWIESNREAFRREHEDEVRFHDERLNAYVAYMAATSSLFAAATVWATSQTATLLNDPAGLMRYAAAQLAPYNAAFWRVSMLAGAHVREHLKAVHGYVEQITKNDSDSEVVMEMVKHSIPARAAFEQAAKSELSLR